MLLLVPLMIVQCYTRALGDTPDGHEDCDSSNMASTYVPIESWVYPAIERLALAGYIQTAFAGLRPWTRMEIARLISEAQERQADQDSQDAVDEQMNSLVKALAREFAEELRQRDGECNRQATIDSIYSRSAAIAGSPITDGYHFAQTLLNDYGRPYGQGENLYSGIAARAASGSFASYVRFDLQRTAPAAMAPASADAAIAAADFTPLAAQGPVSGFTRGRAARRLCLLRFSQQSVQLWKASDVVGPVPGRTAPIQQQRGADQHVPL